MDPDRLVELLREKGATDVIIWFDVKEDEFCIWVITGKLTCMDDLYHYAPNYYGKTWTQLINSIDFAHLNTTDL